MEKTYTVYRLISPNTKMYVGVTARKLYKRWCGGTDYKHSNAPLWADICKYGWTNFVREAIATGLTRSEAEELEKVIIERHNLTDSCSGYNLQTGGLSGFNVSDETKRKMSQSRTGVLNYKSKAVYQCTLDGEIIRKWACMHDWVRANPTVFTKKSQNPTSNISMCCKGKKKTAYGYKWRYVEEGEN